MSTDSLKKDVETFNNSFAKTEFYKQVKRTVKGASYTLDIGMFAAPPADHPMDKKQAGALKETRKQYHALFKEKRDAVPLDRGMWVTAIPELLARVLEQAGRAGGYNRKQSTGGELFSIVGGGAVPAAMRLLNIIGDTGLFYRCHARVTFNGDKIKQVTPVEYSEPGPGGGTGGGAPGMVTPAELRELAAAWKNHQSLSQNIKDELNTGLDFFDALRGAGAAVRTSLLAAAVDWFIQPPERHTAAYFNAICRELAGKIGFRAGDPALFDAFHRLREPGGKGEPLKKVNRLLPEIECFYRLLLKKMIADPVFLGRTLPALRASRKKDLKKSAVKKRWRKFPGRYLSRLWES